MAGTVIADKLEAASTSTLVLKNGVATTPPTIQDSAGTEIGTFCRAWVNFNGTGTVAIRADFNVTDILDNGVGDYTVNFTTVMPDADYTWVGNGQTLNSLVTGDTTAKTASQLFIATAGATNNTKFDETSVTIAVFR
jgi:hypothetical protein